ncbi:hypothetical protein G9A89_001709 [Geosiphon pyriformis]|nr:hypothetical protein G9A89_001709 [Geosiphon pyriformis]
MPNIQNSQILHNGVPKNVRASDTIFDLAKDEFAKLGILAIFSLRRIDIGPRQKTKWRDRLNKQQLLSLKLSYKELKRQEIINEIVLTEQEYLSDLKFVHKNFSKPANRAGVIMEVPEQVTRIFSNMEDMIRLHDHIYMSLQTRQSRQDPVVQCISDVFLPFVDRFDIYEAYLLNYTSATQHVDRMMRTQTEYGRFLKEKERLPDCRKLPLQAFLIAPVQRLAKYPLLFKGLLDVTFPDSLDYESTFRLYKQMDSLIRKLEDEKLREDTLERLETLESRIQGLAPFKLAVRDRQLVHEGVLRRLVTPPKNFTGSPIISPLAFSHGSLVTIYVLLFDDVVLWTRKEKKKEIHKLLEPPARITHVTEIPDKQDYSNLFECTSVHNGRATFVLQANNPKEKLRWINSFQSVLRKHTNRGIDDTHDKWWFYNQIKEESRKSLDL